MIAIRAALLATALAGCRGSDNPATPDAAGPDAPLDAFVDKSRGCVGTFGDGLANGFGRLDGTVVAIVAPGNTTCPRPNSTHLVLEVRQGGDVYRMVAAVSASPSMALAERAAPLAGPAWQEGWHLGVQLDYPTTLDLHSDDFTPMPMAQLVGTISAQIDIGARISVFATVEDQPDSAHLIHRNATNIDGAIVIDPDTSPRYLALRFNQLF